MSAAFDLTVNFEETTAPAATLASAGPPMSCQNSVVDAFPVQPAFLGVTSFISVVSATSTLYVVVIVSLYFTVIGYVPASVLLNAD